MKLQETKKVLLVAILSFLVFFVLPKFSNATDYSSGSFTVKDPVIDEGTTATTSASFGLGQSIGQLAIGKSTSASFELWSGFQYYFKVNANTLTATPGNGEVDLLWTVPQTFLGITVASYEVGTGTSSGSYVFENVGLVTSFTKLGLGNGTPYFFIIRALGPGGIFLTYSNEATATPNGAVTPTPTPGGGGGGNANVVFTGTAYPNATVSLVRNGTLTTSTTAYADGTFSIQLSNISSGSNSFSLYAFDADNVKSANLNVLQNLPSNVTTTVNGLIIAPTLSSSHATIKQGENVTLKGYTAPNSPVAIHFTGQENFIQNVSSSTTGYYSFVLNTTSHGKGDYTIWSVAKVGGIDSPPSLTVLLKIADQTVVTPPGECRRSDLNCDNRVNLIDFSILLYYWDSSNFSRNPRVDIDKSGHIGLRDLSIMLYDWTG